MPQLLFMILVVLALPRRARDLIAYVKVLIEKMTGNAWFPSPTPPLPAVTTALAAFETAETSMQTTKGAKADRAAKRSALIALLKHLRDYVEGICQANVDNAAAIASSAGMTLKAFKLHIKAAFSVTQGPVSGSVVCEVRAVASRATYYFSYSVDEKSWISAPDSMKCKVTISGLTPGQTYYFRYRTLTHKGGLSDFSQVISFLVK